jgi:hypothetical protein
MPFLNTLIFCADFEPGHTVNLMLQGWLQNHAEPGWVKISGCQYDKPLMRRMGGPRGGVSVRRVAR